MEASAIKSKPLGPPKEGLKLPVWHTGTINGVTCEICGTVHPERDENDDTYRLGNFLGKQVVCECCGRIFEIAYLSLGKVFAEAKLHQFSKNPLADITFLSNLIDSVKKAETVLEVAGNTLGQLSDDLSKIK